MTLYDKVKSILTIPDKNSNDSIVNATDLYLEWEKGDGQCKCHVFQWQRKSF